MGPEQVLLRCEVEHVAFDRLDKSMSWWAELWKLEDSRRDIPVYQIEVVPWTRASPAPVQFWPPKRTPTHRMADGGRKEPGPEMPIHAGDEPPPVEGEPALDFEERESGEGGGGCGLDPEDPDYLQLEALLLELEEEHSQPPDPEPEKPPPLPPPPAPPMPSSSAASSSTGVDPPPHVGEHAVVDVNEDAPRSSYLQIPVLDTRRRRIGHFRHNTHGSRFDIHGELHPGNCTVGRSYLPWEGEGRMTELRASQGRPLAWLVAWNRLGATLPATAAGREAHMKMKLCKGDAACLGDGTKVERQVARAYVESEPSFAGMRRDERQPRPGEPLEPPGRF